MSQGASALWSVDIWRSGSGLECCVADTRSGAIVVSRPLKSLTASSIVEVLDGAIREPGLPWGIATDCSRVFSSQEFSGFLWRQGIIHQVSPAGL
jgi:hypothetical protein